MSLPNIVVDNNKGLHPYVDAGKVLIKKSHTESFPHGVNIFSGWRRQAPLTNVTTGSAISDNQNVEILIDGEKGGFIDQYIAEVELAELGNADDATVSTQLLFKNTDIYHNGQKDKFHAMLPEEWGYLYFLDLPYEELRKIRLGLAIGADYAPITDNLAQNGTRKYYIPLPIFRGTPFDHRLVKGGIKFHFFFNAASVFCSSSGSVNVGLVGINILYRQLNIPMTPISKPLGHKYINWIRNTETVNNMTASNTYNIKLNSHIGYCSHLVVMLRTASPIGNYTKYNTFLGNVASVALLDRSSQKVGIEFTKEMNNYLLCNNFNSDFIVSHPTGANIFLIPFNMTPSSAKDGVLYGNFYLTGNEYISISLNSSFSTANVTVDIWAAMCAEFFIMPNGDLANLRTIVN